MSAMDYNDQSQSSMEFFMALDLKPQPPRGEPICREFRCDICSTVEIMSKQTAVFLGWEFFKHGEICPKHD